MLLHNVRYTLRLLRRSPGFTTIAVLTLALGIGANTAVFSVVDAVMLRPLPYADPSRLVSLWEINTQRNGSRSTVAPGNLVDYAATNRTFAGLAGFASSSMSLTKAGTPEQLQGEAVTWNLFSVIGVSPAIGRPFLAEEDRPGREHVVILSDSVWRARFAADPLIVGRSITLNGEPYEVIGVMPAGFQALTQFRSTVEIAFFVPAAYSDELLANHGDHEIFVVGRLKPGISIAQAQADLSGISTELGRRFPDTNRSVRALIAPLGRDVVRNVRMSLLLMLGAVALVLLIACVNLANLLIVRAVGQRQEVAIRMALGANRSQIAADVITRGLVLAVLGGAAGLLCGLWTRDALVAIAPASIPRLDHLAMSWRVLAMTIALSLITGVVAGLLPALHASRRATAATLKAAALTVSGTRSLMRWRGMLMAGEIAAALVLAVGAGLLVRSVTRLTAIDLGFETDKVLTMSVRLPETKYTTAAARATFFAELARRVEGIPGVRSTAFANQFPMRGGWGTSVRVPGPSGDAVVEADCQAVSPGYFATLGIPLMRGRLLTANDRDGAQRVAVVSQTFVRKYLGGREPIGYQFARTGPEAPSVSIVGVVGEIRRDGKEADLQPQVYLSAAQTDLYPVRLASLAVRATAEPYSLVPAIQRAVWSIDPDQPITGVRTLDDVLTASMAQRRFNLTLLAAFAALAVALALVGVYGVVSYAAVQRTREIGIRVALGASRTDVIALVVRSGLRWAIAGVVAGLMVASAATRLMTTMLFDVSPTDPVTFAAIAVAMVAVAIGASYIPARRAAMVDPIAALRAE